MATLTIPATCVASWLVCTYANGTGDISTLSAVGQVTQVRHFDAIADSSGVAGQALVGTAPGYVCKPGIFLPAAPFEELWSPAVRAVLYLILMLWMFLAVAIVADVFVEAVERITAQERTVTRYNKTTGKTTTYRVLVWNKTLATLSLLALGTSAPEILIATIEAIHVLNMPVSDGLGPANIVGSAGYNLMIIYAVSVLFLQRDQSRSITDVKVFVVTSMWSMITYLWLIIVLEWNSPNVVELWEALVTLLAFPLFLLHAYLQSTNCMRTSTNIIADAPSENPRIAEDQQHEERIAQLIRSTKGPDTDEAKAHTGDSPIGAANDAVTLADVAGHMIVLEDVVDDENRVIDTVGTQFRRSAYLGAAIRAITGGPVAHGDVLNYLLSPVGAGVHAPGADANTAIVSFARSEEAAFSDQDNATIEVRRTGCITTTLKVKYTVMVHTHAAAESETPVSFEGTCTFEPFQSTAAIQIHLKPLLGNTPFPSPPGPDATTWPAPSPPELLCLLRPAAVTDADDEVKVDQPLLTIISDDGEQDRDSQDDNPEAGPYTIGEPKHCHVTMLKDDVAGIFSFETSTMTVVESCGKVQIPVVRTRGGHGRVMIDIKATSGTAVRGQDFDIADPILVFNHDQAIKNAVVSITDTQAITRSVSFTLSLMVLFGRGARVGPTHQLTVNIVPDPKFVSSVRRISQLLEPPEIIKPTTWSGQFWRAVTVRGSDEGPPSTTVIVLHVVSLFWKIVCACLPPAHIWGGWALFASSLAVLGLQSALIADAATIFGCATGIPDPVTAMTLVAAGTSVPDTFASLLSARHSTDADDAVGNITGTNAVNVLVGLGIPWTLSAIYHQARGTVFQVSAGSLVSSCAAYMIAALIVFAILAWRRATVGELGGPMVGRWVTFGILIALYVGVMVVSCLAATGVWSFV